MFLSIVSLYAVGQYICIYAVGQSAHTHTDIYI